MAYIEPNTVVKILAGVPFDPDYENTMYFANATAQETYMNGKVVYTINKNSYQRKNRGTIKVGLNVDISGGSIKYLYNANYMMFKNSNFENKWFYAFVTKVEYVNNNTVEISYKIDVIQTWLFAFRFNQCLIEREHTTTDVAGENTIPEKLEHGPYREDVPTFSIDNQSYSSGYFQYTPAVCMVTTFNSQGSYAPGVILGGLNDMGDSFSGLYFTVWELTTSNVSAINATLETIASDTALLNGVVALFMCPLEFIEPAIHGGHILPKYLYFSKSINLDGYVPRNKKLFTYPYSFLYVYNNQGNSAEFRWEEFSNLPELALWGTLSTNPGMSCAPMGYKGVPFINEEEVLTVTGFPMCSWCNDAFKAWLAQNAGTITASVVGLGLSWATMLANPVAGGLAEVNRIPELRNYQVAQSFGKGFSENWDASAGQSYGTIGATLGLLGQIYDHKRQPPQAHGNGNSNLQYQSGLMTFLFRRKFIKAEYARIIDNYFDMYGYATHRVGTPNLNARPCYSYVKTVGASIDGDLPVDDVEEIEKIFDRGVRFWKSSATFGSFDPAVNNNRPT